MQAPAPAPQAYEAPKSHVSLTPMSEPSPTMIATMDSAMFKRRPQWKFGLSAIALVDRAHFDSFNDEGKYYSDLYSDTDYVRNRTGGVISMGYRFTPGFGMNLFVGDAGHNKVIVGADAEWVPVRLDVGSFDLLELGGIFGISNVVASSGYSQTALPHAGLRLNINLGPHFTLTSSARVNRAYSMAEAGIAVNL